MNKKYLVNPTAAQPAAVYLQDGQIYYTNATQWYGVKNEPANLIDVTIAFQNGIYALDGQGRIHRWLGAQSWQQDPDAQNIVSLMSDSSGHLWCVNTQGQVYYKPTVSSSWQFVDCDIPAKATDGVWEYTVRKGDWLWKIVATEYCTTNNHILTASLVERVKLLNPNVGNWDVIQPGLKLKMPPR